MKRLPILFLLLWSGYAHTINPNQENYEFTGNHLLVSYLDCDPQVLNDSMRLFDGMKRGVEAAGATFLDFSEKRFSPEGYTLMILLSESHATIHTYPEYNACFVDFFTCGTSCDSERFHLVMKDLLSPKTVVEKTFYRGNVIEELQ